MPRAWLHPAWLSWRGSPERINVNGTQSSARPYQLLSHAESLLSADSTREARADALINLRRAIDLRVRHLNERFNLKAVPISDKPKAALELLEFFGLVRPIMASNLIETRNAIEHEDEPPPEPNRLKEMVEFTWYFLRSSDFQIQPSGPLNFDSPRLEKSDSDDSRAPPYRISVEIDPNGQPPWEPTIKGFVPAFALLEHPKDGYVALEMVLSQSRTEREQYSERLWWEKRAQVAAEDDIFITAKVRGTAEHLRTLVQRYILL